MTLQFVGEYRELSENVVKFHFAINNQLCAEIIIKKTANLLTHDLVMEIGRVSPHELSFVENFYTNSFQSEQSICITHLSLVYNSTYSGPYKTHPVWPKGWEKSTRGSLQKK